MGEAKDKATRGPIVFWLTQREEVMLALTVISRVGAETKGDRRQKAAVLSELDLGWVEETADGDGIEVSGAELVRVYDQAVAAGRTTEEAMVAVALHGMRSNRFHGKRDTTKKIRKELSRALAGWLTEKLDRLPAAGRDAMPGSVDDLLLARVEERLARATDGDLKLPPEFAIVEDETPGTMRVTVTGKLADAINEINRAAE